MSRKDEPDDLDRTYTVHSCPYGVWVMGRYGATDDLSALMKAWHYRGLRYCSLEVAKQLGALVAVCDGPGSADAWLSSLDPKETEGECPY